MNKNLNFRQSMQWYQMTCISETLVRASKSIIEFISRNVFLVFRLNIMKPRKLKFMSHGASTMLIEQHLKIYTLIMTSFLIIKQSLSFPIKF